MIIQLDPFHMMRAIHCDEPEVVVGSQSYVFEADRFQSNFDLLFDCENGGPECAGPSIPFGAGYENSFVFILSAPLIVCSQAIFSVTGVDSGASEVLDIAGFYASLGWDCFAPDCDFCHHQIGDRAYALSAATIGEWNSASTPPRLQGSIRLTTKVTRGFIKNECLDLQFPSAPTRTITSITQRTASTVWIAVSGDLQPDQSSVNVSGTVNYDGGYVINDPAAGRFWVSKPYIEDEFGGAVQAKYDGDVGTFSQCA